MSERIFHTLEEAARFMGESVERVRQRVDSKELPHKRVNGKVMIPALSLRDFYYDHLPKATKADRTPKPNSTPPASATVQTPKEKSTGATTRSVSSNSEWLSTAFNAAKLAGMSAADMHRLGLEGKVRTRKVRKGTYYYRPDVEALKEPTGSSNATSSPPKPNVTSPRAPRVDPSGSQYVQGDDTDVSVRAPEAEWSQEFHGTTIGEAVSVAAQKLGVGRERIVYEVVDRGSAASIGAGRRHARIKARVAESSADEQGAQPAKSKESKRHRVHNVLASVEEIIDLTPEEALARAQTFLRRHGYQLVRRTDDSVYVKRFQPSLQLGDENFYLSVKALPQPQGGIKLVVRGDDEKGFKKRQAEWTKWVEDLSKKARVSSDRPAETLQELPEKQTSKGAAEIRNNTLYYTVDEVSQKLGKAPHEVWIMAFFGKLQVETVGEQRLFLKQTVDDLLQNPKTSSGDGSARSSKPESGTSGPSAGSRYFAAEEAAKLLDASVDDVWHLVFIGQLQEEVVDGERVLPKQAVYDLLSESGQASQGRSSAAYSTSQEAQSASKVDKLQAGEGYYYTPAQAERLLSKRFFKDVQRTLPKSWIGGRLWFPAETVDALAKQKHGDRELNDAPRPTRLQTSDNESIEEDAKRLQDELQQLRAANERLTTQLEQEREGRLRDTQNAQYEIAQLEAELENNRRSSGEDVVSSQLRQERAARQEAERWARELEAQLDTEKDLNLEKEQRFADLEAKLHHSESRRKEVEDALSSEKKKVRRLEKSERLLDDVRRLLGAVELKESLEPEGGGTSYSVTEDVAEEFSQKLVLQTPLGQISFFPPFSLTSQDEELLRLIAKEDELTAEQIRKHTGRRRAAGELEDLLDRLADEGIRDLVVEVSEDRYRFNSAALHDD